MQIIDNFFDDPYKIRKMALGANYWMTAPQWPGRRAPVPLKLQELYVNKMKNLFSPQLVVDECYFQTVNKSWANGSCHDDGTGYTAITFLNLTPPPDTGTEVYSEEGHKLSESLSKEIGMFESIKRRYYESDRNPIQKFFYEKKLKQYNSHFTNPCVISNKFNRTVVFDSPCVHRAQNFFGNNVNDSRLTLIFFLEKNNSDLITRRSILSQQQLFDLRKDS